MQPYYFPSSKSYFRNLAIVTALGIAGLYSVAAFAQAAGTSCQLQKEAELPMTVRAGRFLVEVEVNDEKRLFVVDSGAEKTALSPELADALNLPYDRRSAQTLVGVGEKLASDFPRVVGSIRLGPAQWTDMRLLTTGTKTLAPFAEPNLGGVLGADILSRYDVELDFPRRTMTLYTAQNCLGRFAPWHGDYQSYSPDYTQRHRFIMDLGLNGHPVHAVLDTGAGASLVGNDAAVRAGVDDAMLAQDRASTGQGVAGTHFATYIHRFDSVQVGTRVFHNARMEIGDTAFPPGIDMLLGMDFMRSRRVWLSYSTGWVFMQYEGASGDANRTTSASRPVEVTRFDAAQFQEADASGAPWANLPPGPIPQFSSHSHMTYRMIPHITEAPRLSPQAIPQSGMTMP